MHIPKLIFMVLGVLPALIDVAHAQIMDSTHAVEVALKGRVSLPYVEFDTIDVETKVSTLNQMLLGTSRSASEPDVHTRSYLYYHRDGGRLWFTPFSGRVRWRSKDFEAGWELGAHPLAHGVSEEVVARARDFLLTRGLATDGPMDRLVFSKTRRLARGSVSADGTHHTEVVVVVSVDFAREVGSLPMVGGAYARVQFGADWRIVGVDVLWRPIAAIGAVSDWVAEDLDVRLEADSLDLVMAAEREIVGYDASRATAVLVNHNSLRAQERALPYLRLPACLDGVSCESDSAPVYGPLFSPERLEEGVRSVVDMRQDGP